MSFLLEELAWHKDELLEALEGVYGSKRKLVSNFRFFCYESKGKTKKATGTVEKGVVET